MEHEPQRIFGVFIGGDVGLGLVLGLLGRVAAFGIACTMAVAATLVHARHGFFMNWSGTQGGEGLEYFLLAIGAALTIIIKGSGAWSLDAWLFERAPGFRVLLQQPTSR